MPPTACPHWCEADHSAERGQPFKRHIALILDLDQRITIWVTRSDTLVGQMREPERVEVTVALRTGQVHYIHWDAPAARDAAELLAHVGADEISHSLRQAADLIDPRPTESVPQAR
ncbi:hypothetical protein [Nocardiopsis sp. YSL2]|uniref:hypothetical protein n=1 Tax=Nocardiopsis sp. YSL2 TaxID=2939492 RepID=UPI0026F4580B|nr:hypothetical protein [Nocardiopsis sp. YSL2]